MSGEGKRRRDRDEEEDGIGSAGTGTVDRNAAIAGAKNAVLDLAKKSQHDALRSLRTYDEKILDDTLATCWRGVLVDGPGASPFLVILKGLLPKLLGNSFQEGMSGADLLLRLESWNASMVTSADVTYLAQFAEEHSQDQFFEPGPHLGGDVENALFEWVDAAITIVSF